MPTLEQLESKLHLQLDIDIDQFLVIRVRMLPDFIDINVGLNTYYTKVSFVIIRSK
jgi:hypothetical protein